MNKEWRGLLTIEEISHHDESGKILWQDKNLTNILHNTGENLLLASAFSGLTLPNNYFFGLDSRTELTTTGGSGSEALIYPYIQDNITIATGPTAEPSGNGYSRVFVTSDSFVIVLDEDNHYRANGPIISFLGSGSGWGPVSNLFMGYTNQSSQDVIIATVPLSQVITINNGQVINARMALKLIMC